MMIYHAHTSVRICDKECNVFMTVVRPLVFVRFCLSVACVLPGSVAVDLYCIDSKP